MMSKIDEDMFSEILYDTGILQPVSSSSKGGKVEAMCRIVQGKEKDWPVLAEKLLRSTDAEVHVCRRYVLKNDAMVYGIHVSVEAKSAKALKAALVSMKPAPVPSGQQVTKPAVMSYAEFRKQTTAPPRPPGEPAKVDPPPPGFSYQSKVVASGKSENGKLVVIEEIPIPHVHHEMNVPNSKGRGAKYV